MRERKRQQTRRVPACLFPDNIRISFDAFRFRIIVSCLTAAGAGREKGRHPSEQFVSINQPDGRIMQDTSNLTPAMRQYMQMKAETPEGAVLLFRMGDFYEMF